MQEIRIRPTYAAAFACIGSACEDTCCQGWTVPVDQATWQRYRALPPSPLRTLIQASLVVNEPEEPGGTPSAANFARFQMNDQNACPLLTAEKLCGVQKELGAGMLSRTCATYPRIVHEVGNQQEIALALSCPEAARLVLLSRDLLAQPPAAEQAAFPPSDMALGPSLAEQRLPEHFWAIRAAVLRVIRDRGYPLWQRMFLLDLMCRRLDAIGSGELNRTVPRYLAGFEASVGTRALREAMDTLPADNAAQMDVLLRLAGLMLHKSNVRPRFVECVQAFTAGIGNRPGATMESLCAQAAQAHQRSYAPFFDRHPHILENLLVNAIFRRLFPYGKQALAEGTRPQMTRQFAQLAAQFVLLRGLLIGAAGFYAEKFSAAHVVHTVQAASKHFEHHPEFLTLAEALLKEAGMDGPRGIAILLRNPQPDRASDAAIPAVAERSAPDWQAQRSASAPSSHLAQAH